MPQSQRDKTLERDRYVHFVQTINWAILAVAVFTGYEVLDGYFPHIVIVALIAITAGNTFVLLNRFQITYNNNDE